MGQRRCKTATYSRTSILDDLSPRPPPLRGKGERENSGGCPPSPQGQNSRGRHLLYIAGGRQLYRRGRGAGKRRLPLMRLPGRIHIGAHSFLEMLATETLGVLAQPF